MAELKAKPFLNIKYLEIIMENEFIYPFDENLKEEVLQTEEDNYAELPPEDIVAFNELRSCADIYRMFKTKQLEIQPYFQPTINTTINPACIR